MHVGKRRQSKPLDRAALTYGGSEEVEKALQAFSPITVVVTNAVLVGPRTNNGRALVTAGDSDQLPSWVTNRRVRLNGPSLLVTGEVRVSPKVEWRSKNPAINRSTVRSAPRRKIFMTAPVWVAKHFNRK